MSPFCPHRGLVLYFVVGLALSGTAVAAPVTLDFQQGTAGYAGAEDVSIYAAAPTSNYGARGDAYLRGNSRINYLLRFDELDLTPGFQVQGAVVRLVMETTTPDTVSMSVSPMVRDWVEGTMSGTGTPDGATWENDGLGNAWATAGAMGATDKGAALDTISASVPGHRAWFEWTLDPALVQSWIDNPSENFGLVFVVESTSNGTPYRVASTEDATAVHRPVLRVTGVVPEPTSAALLGAGVVGIACSRRRGG